ISKKEHEELMQRKTEFIEGACANGYTAQVAADLFALIERFANYGFNRSHAVAYSVISYQLTYIKAHYPLAFYTALLASVWNQRDKLLQYFQECKKKDIKVLP